MTAALIPITGVADNYRVPGALAELLFAQGPASASAGVRNVCLVMPMCTGTASTSGNWTSATLYAVPDAKTAEDGGGPGSPIHRGARKFLASNKNAKLWALPVAQSSGGSPIKATWTLVLATVPTATGTVTVNICGEDSSATYSSGTALATTGAALAAAINAKTWLPVTAAFNTLTLTVSAKLPGASQGTATIRAIPCRATVSAGTGTTITASGAFLGTGVAGVDGSTTEAANTLTALTALTSVARYYLVSSAIDATTLGHFKSHLSTKAEPRQGMRSCCISAYVGTLAACQTLANGLNYERNVIALQTNSDHDPCEIAGNVAAVLQKGQQTDSTKNFAGYSAADWAISPAYAVSDWPDTDDQNDAINDGITIIASKDGGSYIVMLVDARSKNSTGAVDDFRACEFHRVSGADEFVDEMLVNTVLNHQGKKFKNDEFLADGTVNTNQKVIRGVLTPSQLAPGIKKQLDDYSNAGKLQDVAASKESLRLVKSPANASRCECGLDLHVIDHAHQFTFRVAEVSTG
jgi:phage tail sheath gpL-like